MKHKTLKNTETRELTDKELHTMTSAMGNNIRSQSLQVANIIKENLKAEFASRRKTTPTPITTRKSVAA